MPGGRVLLSGMPKGIVAEPQEYVPGYKGANSKGLPSPRKEGQEVHVPFLVTVGPL